MLQPYKFRCYDVSQNTPPNGLQLTLDRLKSSIGNPEPGSTAEIQPDGEQEIDDAKDRVAVAAQHDHEHTDSVVMKTVGYWQLRANPGVWDLRIAEKSRGAEIYYMVDGSVKKSGRIQLSKNSSKNESKTLVMKDFTNQGRLLLVKRRKGFEQASLFGKDEGIDLEHAIEGEMKENETVHIFSLATGHAYERLLKIMMLSVTKRTSSPVKFWLFENVRATCVYCETVDIPTNHFWGDLHAHTIAFALLVSVAVIQIICKVHGGANWL